MPDYLKSIQKVREEQPDVSGVSIEPSGFFGKLFGGRATATASPWSGDISYNPDNMSGMSPDQIENILTHELTHSRQIQNTPYLSRFTNVLKSMIPGMDESYYNRPREMEAYQSERDRSSRLGLPNMADPVTGRKDIELPPISKRIKTMSMFDR